MLDTLILEADAEDMQISITVAEFNTANHLSVTIIPESEMFAKSLCFIFQFESYQTNPYSIVLSAFILMRQVGLDIPAMEEKVASASVLGGMRWWQTS